jgi:hypothetical protein
MTVEIIKQVTIVEVSAVGVQGAGSSIDTDTGWQVSGGYTPRKTIDVTNYNQAQLMELLVTLIDTLKLSKLPTE